MLQKYNLHMSRKMNANTLRNYYSLDYFMLYLYHLLDIVVKGLRVTPFLHYTERGHYEQWEELCFIVQSYQGRQRFPGIDNTLILRISVNHRISLFFRFRGLVTYSVTIWSTVTFSTKTAHGNRHRGIVGGTGWSNYKNDIKICILPEKYKRLI